MLTFITTVLRDNRLTLILMGAFFLASCASQQQAPDDVPIPPSVVFDKNSWKATIADSCQSFYDGCNSCMRGEDSEVIACTRRYCHAYTQPTCMDEQAANNTPTSNTLTYTCPNEHTFLFVTGLYTSGDQRVALNNDQAMLVDQKTHIATPLERKISASGEKFSNEKITFWIKGKEALLLEGDDIIYQSCQQR